MFDGALCSPALPSHQMSILDSRNFNINGGNFNDVGRDQIINNFNVENAEKWIKERLKAPEHSKLGDGCMEGTRLEVIQRIKDWLADVNGKNILWISASPGAGKTAIATTVVRNVQLPHARFFFRRDDFNARDPNFVWRRIALDLAMSDPIMKDVIIDAIAEDRRNPEILDISQQFECLVKSALEERIRRVPDKPLFVTIDALDECDLDEDLLVTLGAWSSELPKLCKLLITSRDDSVIRDALEDISEWIHLDTGGDVSLQTSLDLYIFISTHCQKIARRHRKSLPPEWPGQSVIMKLVGYASGLFIWAKAALEFVGKAGDPVQRLKIVTAGDGKGVEAVDSLYHQVLQAARQDLLKAEQSDFDAVIAAIVLAKSPLGFDDLEKLLGVSRTLLESIVRDLSPILSMDKSDKALRVCHQTVTDYLLTSSRSVSLCIDRQKQSNRLALGCLKVLNTGLKFNMFGIKTSHCFNENLILERPVHEVVTSALGHAARYWASYLETVDENNLLPTALIAQFETFVYEHLLHWLEVLSLCKAVLVSPKLLLAASKWIKIYDRIKGLYAFCVDASRFVSHFREPISRSAPHIYISALSFSPQRSLVRTHFSKMFSNILDLKRGRMSSWPRIMFNCKGHNQLVLSVKYSPDGNRIVSGSYDSTIRIWDADTGESVLGSLEGHIGWVWSVGFSPNGKYIVSGSFDRTIRIWNADTGETVIRPLRGHNGSVLSVEFSSDGKRIVSGSDDNTIRVWDADTGVCIMGPLEGHVDSVWSVGFSPSGNHIISGSSDNTIRLWDANAGKCVMGPLEGHSGTIYSVSFSTDGRRFVSGSFDSTIRVWDVDTAETVKGPLKGHNGLVYSVAFSPDGKYIVSGSSDKSIRIWNANTGESVMRLFNSPNGSVFSVDFSPDGKRIASGSSDSAIRIWDADTSESDKNTAEGHNGPVYSVGLSLDGKRIVSGSEDSTIRIWDADIGESIIGPLEGHHGSVMSVGFSPDGKRIVSGSFDGQIWIWDADSGRSIKGPLKGHHGSVYSTAFSLDGKLIVSGYSDNTVGVWDADTGETVMEPLRGHKASVMSVGFSPAGNRIVSGSFDKTVRLWDADTGKSFIGPLIGHDSSVLSVQFSPDGKRVVSGSEDSTIRIWDADTGETVIGPLRGHTDSVWSVGFSPSGNRIVSSSFDKTIRIWDTNTGKSIIGPLTGHDSSVLSVKFSPDGNCIVSGSYDRTIRIWDTDTGESIMNPLHNGSDRSDSSLGFSTNRESVVSDGDDIPVAIQEWDVAVPSIQDPSLNTLAPVLSENLEQWVCDAKTSSLLFWVPPQNAVHLNLHPTVTVIGRSVTQLDWRRFFHGEDWQKCCCTGSMDLK